jgi:hypothetical protein
MLLPTLHTFAAGAMSFTSACRMSKPKVPMDLVSSCRRVAWDEVVWQQQRVQQEQ